ncbi:MAG TPA: fluoride efflux transporter CrcB [Candidatus Binatia bacterium]|nr:fluoride efflux transporter CrcB [Candidatus Binatia bacterium]
MEYLVIGLGGFLGANARYLVAGWAAQRFGAIFPYGTFIINISGSFILGFFMAFLSDRAFIHPNYRLFFATGFLGAYTTFSTFTYESLQLLQDGSTLLGFTNILGSVIAGLVGVFLGFVLGGLF